MILKVFRPINASREITISCDKMCEDHLFEEKRPFFAFP